MTAAEEESGTSDGLRLIIDRLFPPTGVHLLGVESHLEGRPLLRMDDPKGHVWLEDCAIFADDPTLLTLLRFWWRRQRSVRDFVRLTVRLAVVGGFVGALVDEWRAR